MNIGLNKSISELEGWIWTGDIPNNDDSYVVQTFYRLHDLPVCEMSLADIRFLIGQNSGLEYLVPLIIEELSKDIFVEVEYYPGDLLCSLLLINSEPNYWMTNSSEKQRLMELYVDQKKNLGTAGLPQEIISKIKDAYSDFIGI
jgi:hypothetical protein